MFYEHRNDLLGRTFDRRAVARTSETPRRSRERGGKERSRASSYRLIGADRFGRNRANVSTPTDPSVPPERGRDSRSRFPREFNPSPSRNRPGKKTNRACAMIVDGIDRRKGGRDIGLTIAPGEMIIDGIDRRKRLITSSPKRTRATPIRPNRFTFVGLIRRSSVSRTALPTRVGDPKCFAPRRFGAPRGRFIGLCHRSAFDTYAGNSLKSAAGAVSSFIPFPSRRNGLDSSRSRSATTEAHHV